MGVILDLDSPTLDHALLGGRRRSRRGPQSDGHEQCGKQPAAHFPHDT